MWSLSYDNIIQHLQTYKHIYSKHTSKFTLPVNVHNLDANNVSSLDVKNIVGGEPGLFLKSPGLRKSSLPRASEFF